MDNIQATEQITVHDEHGQARDYEVEALFDMNEHWYALLRSEDDMILMRVVNDGDEQYLEGIEDPDEAAAILDAYELAVEAEPPHDHNG
ncbi:DUF1292 domain-containing protein [Brevibacillus fulvus]|uniref:Rossmann-fold nucleotide-binding protein n=1 Tax=Brevibacillus fulvus TaxID=1125967 RepID=A0A939BTC7_9BACL|nr:DUF1292 domain-containing protein [Brevibacillus fulvus]MBM7591378.1 putative Rossmann-fold nucleotide-binding protein [Brevibacillus fulvus]